MSDYHYYVALDSVLLACSTMTVVFATSGRHFWRTWAAVCRIILSLIIFILLGIFLGYQTHKNQHTNFPAWMPPDIHVTNDSSLFLPVSCFLDPDLAENDSPYAPRRPQPLTDGQLDRIGRPIKNYRRPYIYLFSILAVAMVVGSFEHIYEYRSRKRPQQSGCAILGWLYILLACLATDVVCALHIGVLKSWTRKSGWMEGGAEDEIYSVGQLLPVFPLALILRAVADKFELSRKSSKNEKHVGSDVYHRV